MKKDFRNAAIILPAILTVILFIAFFVCMSVMDNCIPFSDGETVAYFDSAVSDKEAYSDNSLCGSISCEKAETDIIYNADYSNMNGSASLIPDGARPGETGCVYIKMLPSDIKPFAKASSGKSVTVNAQNKKYIYTYAYKFTSKSEYKITSENPDVSKAMIIYSLTPKGAGISDDYTAYVFELQGGSNGT